jgi:hypothetical protein
MRVGLFWIDAHPESDLRVSIARAAAAFRRRFGQDQDICLVPPGALGAHPLGYRSLRIEPYAELPPHHLWIGIRARAAPSDPAPQRA